MSKFVVSSSVAKEQEKIARMESQQGSLMFA